MIEWGDYQCTFCYRFHQNTLDSLMVYVDSGELRIIFQDFPLNGPDSVLAAQAARCAADQGLFWEYHDVLYQNWGGERTGWIRPPVLYGFALNVGLDMRMYGDCVGRGATWRIYGSRTGCFRRRASTPPRRLSYTTASGPSR